MLSAQRRASIKSKSYLDYVIDDNPACRHGNLAFGRLPERTELRVGNWTPFGSKSANFYGAFWALIVPAKRMALDVLGVIQKFVICLGVVLAHHDMGWAQHWQLACRRRDLGPLLSQECPRWKSESSRRLGACARTLDEHVKESLDRDR
jgi:hypothetical protein